MTPFDPAAARTPRTLRRAAQFALPALVCAALLAACSKPPAATAPRTTLTVQAVSARVEAWPGAVEASGAVAPWQEASIGTEIAGVRLEEILVDVGQRVTRGQLLARFSEESLRADLATLDAQVAEKQASLEKARLDAQSADRLGRAGALSGQELRSVRTQAAIAEAQLRSAKAQRDVQALRLRQAQVLAPDDGVISSRSATVGAVAAPGAELFRLIRQGRLEWRAEVRASALAQLRPGMGATIRLPQGGSITGTLRQVAPTVATDTLSGLAYVDLPAEASLAAGVFVSGEFELPASDALVVPGSALVFRSGSRYVMELVEGDRVREVKVETGRRRGNDVEILSGIAAGARLALAGGAFLSDGDPVSVAP